MWPKVPANFSALSIDELKTFAREVKAHAVAQLRAGVTGDERAEVDVYLAHRDAALAEVAQQEQIAALEADDSDAETPVVEVDVTVPVGETSDDDADDESADDEASTTSTGAAVKVQTTTGQAATRVKVKDNGRLTPSYLKASDDVKGKRPGEAFETWRELAEAASDRAEGIARNTTKKYEVARVKADYPADRILGDNMALNLAKFEPDELMAALCAPATPYYGLACMNTTRRPVFGSLPQFQAPRGKVTVMSSPSLSDITTGVGLWTATDDETPGTVKETCQTITCNDPTTYTVYGAYRCLTVKNLLAMTYPELVEAWLNRLAAAHARLAEQQLLAGIYAGTTELNVEKMGYGFTTSTVRAILQYIALYMEGQRWDDDGERDMWAPRWMKTAIKMDLVSRRNTSGTVLKVPSDAEVDAIFRDVGVNPIWTLDTPTYATAIPAVGVGGNLSRLPEQVQVIIAKKGKFAAIDLGDLRIGVTGNNIYRDNDSNSRNDFTYFFENFEGVVNTDSCPAHTLDLFVCHSGVQQADSFTACNGVDEGGFGS